MCISTIMRARALLSKTTTSAVAPTSYQLQDSDRLETALEIAPLFRTSESVFVFPHKICPTSQSVTRTAIHDKRCWFNLPILQFPSQLESNPNPFEMSDINATRLPTNIYYYYSCVGDDTNPTLIRGDRWGQHLSNDVPIVLICCVLAFVEHPPGSGSLIRSYGTNLKVSPSPILILLQGNCTDLDYLLVLVDLAITWNRHSRSSLFFVVFVISRLKS